MESLELVLTAVGSGGGSFAVSQAVTKWRLNKLEKEADKAEKNINERLAGIRASKKATVTELREEIAKEVRILHERVDKAKEEQKEYEKKANQEFKEINEKLGSLDSKLAAIDGKLDLIINKR